MSEWRYFATRIGGGGEVTLESDLPLSGVEITEQLSGPDALSATITPEVARLKAPDGSLVIEPWNTFIWAEASRSVRGGGILVGADLDGPALSLDVMGLAGYPQGMPYVGGRSYVGADPLQVVRDVWQHLQGSPGGNLLVEVDGTVSPVRVGTPPRTASFTTGAGEEVSFDSGPLVLSWWTTEDCGRLIDQLAQDTPFDYRTSHAWNGDVLEHRLELGYPRLGRRRADLRFRLGENIFEIPPITEDGEGFANSVQVLGAGEGRDMVRGVAALADGRLRRVATVTDKTVRSVRAATLRAQRELARRQNIRDVRQVVVSEHVHAPIGSWRVGDEIQVVADTGWASTDLWHRVVATTIRPEQGTATLELVRADGGAL